MDNSNPLAEKVLEVQNELTEKVVPLADARPKASKKLVSRPKRSSLLPDEAISAVNHSQPQQPEMSPRNKPSARAEKVPERVFSAEMAQRLTRPTVPLTTRLQPRTAEALERAHLERRLKRETPSSKQDITQMALDDWLSTNGYLE